MSRFPVCAVMLFVAFAFQPVVAQDEPPADGGGAEPPVESPIPAQETPASGADAPNPATEKAPTRRNQESGSTGNQDRPPVATDTGADPANSGRPRTGDEGRPAEAGPADRGPGGPPTSQPRRGARDSAPGRSGPPRQAPSGPGNPQENRDFDRSRLGIRIGPGGVQVFRGDPRPGYLPPRYGTPRFQGNDAWRYGANRGNSFYWNSDRGWGGQVAPQPAPPVVVTRPYPVNAAPAAPAQLPGPPVPTAEELAGMPGVELRGLLLYAVDQLDDELGKLNTGEGWRRHLKTAELKRLVPAPDVAPPPPNQASDTATVEPLISIPVRRELEAILQTYESVSRNAQYGRISEIWGFQTVRATLREFLVPPLQRLQTQMSLAVELLGSELQQFDGGAAWNSFLRLNEAKRIAAKNHQDLNASDRQTLRSLVNALDSVAAQPSYRMISDLLGFRMTLHVMRSYLAQLEPPAPPAPPTPKPE